MFELVLYQPQIPPNTGNIIRLCANAGANLHLIHPLGFEITEKSCRRAGLDYHALTYVHHYENWQDFREKSEIKRLFAITKFGTRRYDAPSYQPGDGFLFGRETTGLPDDIHALFTDETRLAIPMVENSRSLNISNAASIILYEAWRQQSFTSP
ncbi:MAG: tRNA (cytidine(34)-2'-O)-methyltransferase [Candidatus Puniceispirillaceae bacterium]